MDNGRRCEDIIDTKNYRALYHPINELSNIINFPIFTLITNSRPCALRFCLPKSRKKSQARVGHFRVHANDNKMFTTRHTFTTAKHHKNKSSSPSPLHNNFGLFRSTFLPSMLFVKKRNDEKKVFPHFALSMLYFLTAFIPVSHTQQPPMWRLIFECKNF